MQTYSIWRFNSKAVRLNLQTKLTFSVRLKSRFEASNLIPPSCFQIIQIVLYVPGNCFSKSVWKSESNLTQFNHFIRMSELDQINFLNCIDGSNQFTQDCAMDVPSKLGGITTPPETLNLFWEPQFILAC